MTLVKRFIVLLWVAAISAQLGCLWLMFGGGAVAGAGIVAYAKGELRTAKMVSLDEAWMATQGAMDELGFTIMSRYTTANSAKLAARGAGNRSVTVGLERRGDLTDIRVRVGTFGDESLSRLILDKILQRL